MCKKEGKKLRNSDHIRGEMLDKVFDFYLLQKKDSHIKIIPAFKPVTSLEPATPDNTPEKPLQPQVRMDRSKVCAA